MRIKNDLTNGQKAKLIQELVKVGAVKRPKPLTTKDSYYSESIGEKGKKVLMIKI